MMKKGIRESDEEGMKKMNLTTKDVIALSAMKFNPSDMMIGDYYTSPFYLQDIKRTSFLLTLSETLRI